MHFLPIFKNHLIQSKAKSNNITETLDKKHKNK